MKATKEPTPFQPVHLILETQEEVDALYAIFNDAKLMRELKNVLDDGYGALVPYRSLGSTKYDNIIDSLLRK